MRRSIYLAAVTGMLMLGLPAFAGNVLVPKDEPSALNAASPPMSMPADDSVSLPTLDPSADVSIAPGAAKIAAPQQSLMESSVPAVNDPTRITQILKIGATEAAISDDPLLPHRLAIAIKDFGWGKDDFDSVGYALRMTPDQVQKHCRPSLTGMLYTDSEQSVYPFDMGTLPKTTIAYDGKATKLIVMARAMCDVMPLPPDAGMIAQIGDKFTAYVSQIDCPPPPSGLSSMDFQYAGDGKSQCVYR